MLLMYAACAITKRQKRLGMIPCSIIARALCRRLLTAVSAAPAEYCSSLVQTMMVEESFEVASGD